MVPLGDVSAHPSELVGEGSRIAGPAQTEHHRPPGAVLVACDKFKGSLTARQVRDIAVGALTAAGLPARGFLVADGGDGTLEACASAGFELTPVDVSGPVGNRVQTAVARRDAAAVVELADACGLGRLPGGRLEPLTASSFGLGQAIRAALTGAGEPPKRLVVGVGGSASSDGGLGLLAGLGAVLRDGAGRPLPPVL
ncbi:MAG: glycerate kinase, partial [Bifidobacteriaceae bacterium]|nr:glycerate kinase [Bifidobacteriaceae bacterium]